MEKEPKVPPIKDAPRYIQIIDELFHLDIESALTESGQEALMRQLSDVSHGQTSGIGEILLKVMMDEVEPTDPDEVRFIAVHYNFVTNDDDMTLQSTGVYIPEGGWDDLMSDPDLQDSMVITLPYKHLNWNEKAQG